MSVQVIHLRQATIKGEKTQVLQEAMKDLVILHHRGAVASPAIRHRQGAVANPATHRHQEAAGLQAEVVAQAVDPPEALSHLLPLEVKGSPHIHFL